MNSNMIDSTQSMVHQGSIFLLGACLLIGFIAIIKPRIFQRLFREFGDRKYVLATSVFVSLLSGTIFLATQPAGQTFVSDTTKQNPGSAVPLEHSGQASQDIIRTEDIQVIEPVAFTKQQQDDPLLPVNQTKIIQAGKDGEKQLIYSVTYQGDQEASRVLKEERVLTEPIPEITAIGSQPQPAPGSGNDQSNNNRPLLRLNCNNGNQPGSGNNPRICLLRD